MYTSDFYSVKFYPYTQPGVDPVFAVVGGKFVSISPTLPQGHFNNLWKQILICRPPTESGNTTEWIHCIINEGVSEYPAIAFFSLTTTNHKKL